MGDSQPLTHAMTQATERILQRVTAALDAIIRAAQPYHGLFPSLINRKTGEMLTELPPAIPGQRQNDRSFLGSNLVHDEPTLMTLYALGTLRPDYTVAADRYLKRFATHCTNTVSGLFPWGEHSYWDLVSDCVGNSYKVADPNTTVTPTHDHLRATPLWLWHKLHQFNPQCPVRFAEGLNNHWVPPFNGHPREYIRHGFITKVAPWTGSKTSCDFPRHGGFYIFDWSFAHSVSRRDEFLTQIRDMLDYWWLKRRPDGLLGIESRQLPGKALYGMLGVAQTLSLGTSLLDAATLIEADQPALAEEMRHRGRVYIRAHFAAPHEPDNGVFFTGWAPDNPAETRVAPIWGSKYGHTPASYAALCCVLAHRQTGDTEALDWARAAGERYASTPVPDGVHIPAMDSGMGLGLLAELYDLTGDATWRDAGLALAEKLIGIYFDDSPLPRGAAGIDWYESQMGPGFLLHGLARIALLTNNPAQCPLHADYTGR